MNGERRWPADDRADEDTDDGPRVGRGVHVDPRRNPVRIGFGVLVGAVLDGWSVAVAEPKTDHRAIVARHLQEHSMTADALTVAPSKAELQVAYLRKGIVSFAPILLAGVLFLSDAVQSGHTLNGVTWAGFVFAILQAAGTFLPSNAVAKLGASLAAAVGAGVVAAVTDGGVSLAEALLITTQFLAWAAAGAMPNGARPDVAQPAATDDLPDGVVYDDSDPFPAVSEPTTFEPGARHQR